MTQERIPVAIERCHAYEPEQIDAGIDRVVAGLAFRVARGSKVLLKPNLVAARCENDLACTHPQFVAAVARWFVDQGARVAVGDSPATGSGRRAMRISGMRAALAGLPVTLAPFTQTCQRRTKGGLEVTVATDALECDYLINLPKLKSHGQARVTLAMKNYYGIIKGWRKAWGHQRYGKGDAAPFFEMLADLCHLVPAGLSICDGVTAMHVTGPMRGKPYALGLIAASSSSLALDRALMEIITMAPERSPLWRTCKERQEHGHDLHHLSFPLLDPQQVRVADFMVPDQLSPVHFGLRHVLASLARRYKVWLLRRQERE